LPTPPPLSSADASAYGRLGGLAKSAHYDGVAGTEKARAAAMARFELEVDPEGVLPAKERQRRALAARRLFYTRISQKAARQRHARAEARKARVMAATERVA
jgi:hypothetical protein